MKHEYFKEQDFDSKPISESDLPELISKTYYDTDWQVGEKMLIFMEVNYNGDEPRNMTFQVTCSREFPQLKKEFNFVDMEGMFPVFRRKETEK